MHAYDFSFLRSTYDLIQTDAWDEAESSEGSMGLREELRSGLIDLYPKVMHKNGLLIYCRRGYREVSDGTGKVKTPLAKILAEITDELKKTSDSIIPQLEKELDP